MDMDIVEGLFIKRGNVIRIHEQQEPWEFVPSKKEVLEFALKYQCHLTEYAHVC